MKIHITGADVEQREGKYEVIYQGQVVFQNSIKDVCIMTALNRELLDQLYKQPKVN